MFTQVRVECTSNADLGISALPWSMNSRPRMAATSLEGAIVDTADSAKKALELLDSRSYDLLISDLGMPEMDGYQLIAELRHQPSTRDLHAIAMSGFGRRADARRVLEAGFNAHVPKPAAVDDLKAAIAKL